MEEEYTLIDAAVGSVENYMKALDTSSQELDINIKPYFNEDGSTSMMEYRVSFLENELGTNQSVNIQHSFEHIDRLGEVEYPNWLERFASEFPEADITYNSTTEVESAIENSVETIKNFLDLSQEVPENLSILVETGYNREQSKWVLEYYVRPTESESHISMNMIEPLGNTEEELETLYPLWISKFKEEFPEVELFYPEPR